MQRFLVKLFKAYAKMMQKRYLYDTPMVYSLNILKKRILKNMIETREQRKDLKARKHKRSKPRRHKRRRRYARKITLLFLFVMVFGSLTFYHVQRIIASNNNGDVYQSEIEKMQALEPTAIINTLNATDEPSWKLILVNPWNALPEDFEVDLVQIKNGHLIDLRILKDLQSMMDDARKAGFSPIVCSGYRTQEKQKKLFENKIADVKKKGFSDEQAEIEAAKWVAIPGTSEHQLGLAVDIVSSSYQVLDESQGDTAVQKWLMKNCYDYGFILRYPYDKSHITGIGYEPWHYRYVGKEVAKIIKEKGITLEEYLEEV